MNRAILVLVAAVIGIAGGILWTKKHGAAPEPTAEKPASDEGEKTSVTRDDAGHVVVRMDDETQGNIGLLVATPEAAQLSPEVKGYGRVLDPSALAVLVMELASAQVASTASSNEFARLKALAGQGNASERALQTAEAAAVRDQLAVQSARDRLTLSWGKAVADQRNLPAFALTLTSLKTFLVRIDLPAGQTLPSSPLGARVVTLSSNSVEAEFLGEASNVDPQTQGQGFIFRTSPDAARLLPGEAVTGYLKVLREPLSGVLIRREAVVRTEGAGWIYVLNQGAESFTRIQIALDYPTEAGWLVTQNVKTNDYVVVTGAQILLSEELKASIKGD